MKVENAKNELVRRYRYLCENAYFILAPYMILDEGRKNNFEYPSIYLNVNVFSDINKWFEEFLLCDKNIEETSLYKFILEKKEDKEYLAQVKYGLGLLDEVNKYRRNFLEELSVFKILIFTSDYLMEQSGDLDNKENKLKVIDEYFRLARYKNDGKMYTSGRKLDLHDCSSICVPLYKKEPFRDIDDVGVITNDFITTIVNIPRSKVNLSIFTEKEKQEIYLDYHDEIPCDYEIVCGLEDEYISTMIDTRLVRPDNTSSCGKKFYVREEDIFVDPDDILYRYYQLCPHCGYIVNVRKEILSYGIRDRIEKRCFIDPKLFRKMYLYSELFSLDKEATTGQKKVLKK